MPNNHQYRLNSYAIAAGCFLYINQEVSSQVVYTDIDPDIILNEGGQTSLIDIDNDGINDFFFHNNSFTYYNGSWLSYRTIQDILIGPEISGNAVQGEIHHIYTGYNSFSIAYAFAIEQNKIISSESNFLTADLDVMAIRTYYDGIVTNIFNTGGSWFPETTNHFIAVRFKDFSLENHYGWIRCDVLDDGRTLIIKDYAYETEPDYPIIAGDTTHYLSVLENTIDANVYSFGKNVYINLNELVYELRINIFDIKGVKIYSNTIVNQNFKIELMSAKGIYSVELFSENKTYRKKVFIN